MLQTLGRRYRSWSLPRRCALLAVTTYLAYQLFHRLATGHLLSRRDMLFGIGWWLLLAIAVVVAEHRRSA